MPALPVVRKAYRTMTERKIARNLILAFDGTKNEFRRVNTNVVNLCAVLKMDDRDSQMVYYQPGIGTYTDPSIQGKFQQWWAKTTDLASAWYLSAHVMRAYEFLMDNYLPGDSIMLFGFSRGAYTARVLASMLDSVGLLSRGNREQVPFAYRIYASEPDLATRFKDTFCTRVDIQLVGLWDTVASMGLFVPKQLPLTSFTSVKHFRHAISLDETRARFNVTLWNHDKPEPQPPTGDQCRVKEMWFVGGHCDVGGGNPHNEGDPLLANIPLRWMLHEIHDLNVGVLFDNKNLDTYRIPTDCVPRAPCPKPRATHATNGAAVPFNDCSTETEFRKAIPSTEEANNHDVTAAITLELKPWSFWWLFQFPVWTKGYPLYWGQRIFPEDHIKKGCTHIHPTVLKHMELRKPYKPNALLPAHWKAHIDGLPDTFE